MTKTSRICYADDGDFVSGSDAKGQIQCSKVSTLHRSKLDPSNPSSSKTLFTFGPDPLGFATTITTASSETKNTVMSLLTAHLEQIAVSCEGIEHLP